MSDEPDYILAAEHLRRPRADRRAAKRRMYLRAFRKLTAFSMDKAHAALLAHKFADQMAKCSCWMCRGDENSPRPASEIRRMARVEPDEREE